MKNGEKRRLRLLRARRKALVLQGFAERVNEGIRDLVDWLNKSKENVQYNRIERLIQRIGEVRKLMPPVSIEEFVKKETSTASSSATVWKKVKRINRQLSQYKVWPRYIVLRTRFTAMHKTPGLSKSTKKKRGPLQWEWWPRANLETNAGLQVVLLEEYGLFDSLLRCSFCDKWFFASKGGQKFCSDQCRDKNYSRSPEGRAKRKTYMREYRKRSKRRDEEAMRAIQKKGTGDFPPPAHEQPS